MLSEGRSPKLAVEKARAMEHAKLTVRRAWVGDVIDFEGYGGRELDPEPIVLHDLNGQELFYEFAIMEGSKVVGTTKASASMTLGSPVPTIEFGPRGWDPAKATEKAKSVAKEAFPQASIKETEFVCYCFPKVGVRVYLDLPEYGKQSMVVDVADGQIVEGFGADELEGSTAYSFYLEQAEPHEAENQRKWDLAERELEAAHGAVPKLFEAGLTDKEQSDLRTTLLAQPTMTPIVTPSLIPMTSSRVIRYAPRCPSRSHDCFVLYAQQTNVYCAVATGQMILDFYRYYFTQDQIATAMSTGAGGTTNSGQVQGYESLSKKCLDATYDTSANWAEAKAEIDANRPLKSGIPGHARACAGWMRQNITLIDQTPKRWLRIYDPWPWNSDICKGGKIVWEDWDAVTHTNFIYVRHRSTPCP